MNGKTLKKERVKLKLTQKQFGALVGLGRSTINAYENNRKVIPLKKIDYFNQILNPKDKQYKHLSQHKTVIMKLDAINEKLNLLLKK